MFDDLIQEKNDQKDEEISPPTATTFVRKLQIGVGIFLIISIYMWSGHTSSKPSGSTHNASEEVSLLKERIASLEMAIQNLQLQQPHPRIESSYSPPFKEAIVIHDNGFSTEQNEAPISLSQEKKIEEKSDSIGIDEMSHPFPREIALELSSLFEKEIAASAPPSFILEKEQPVAPSKKKNAPRVTQPTKTKYIVKKGDTLSKISLQFYGTSKKWKLILDANKNLLGESQNLRSGMTLIIPDPK